MNFDPNYKLKNIKNGEFDQVNYIHLIHSSIAETRIDRRIKVLKKNYLIWEIV